MLAYQRPACSHQLVIYLSIYPADLGSIVSLCSRDALLVGKTHRPPLLGHLPRPAGELVQWAHSSPSTRLDRLSDRQELVCSVDSPSTCYILLLRIIIDKVIAINKQQRKRLVYSRAMHGAFRNRFQQKQRFCQLGLTVCSDIMGYVSMSDVPV